MTYYLKTKKGYAWISADEVGVAKISWPHKTIGSTQNPQYAPKKIQSWLNTLEDYFAGKKVNLLKIPIHAQGTEFQKKVWTEARKVSYGKVCTYKDLAQRIGNKNASRAVGSALGKNPCLILTPCHRILAQNNLGGFSAPGKLASKRYLLQLETLPSS